MIFQECSTLRTVSDISINKQQTRYQVMATMVSQFHDGLKYSAVLKCVIKVWGLLHLIYFYFLYWRLTLHTSTHRYSQWGTTYVEFRVTFFKFYASCETLVLPTFIYAILFAINQMNPDSLKFWKVYAPIHATPWAWNLAWIDENKQLFSSYWMRLSMIITINSTADMYTTYLGNRRPIWLLTKFEWLVLRETASSFIYSG